MKPASTRDVFNLSVAANHNRTRTDTVSIALPAVTPVQVSLFLTLGGRALDSRLPRPFLGDTLADEILKKVGGDDR